MFDSKYNPNLKHDIEPAIVIILTHLLSGKEAYIINYYTIDKNTQIITICNKRDNYTTNYFNENNINKIISVYNNKNILLSREYYDEKFKLHREDGPAHLEYYSNGNKKVEAWLVNGIEPKDMDYDLIHYYNNPDNSYSLKTRRLPYNWKTVKSFYYLENVDPDGNINEKIYKENWKYYHLKRNKKGELIQKVSETPFPFFSKI